jgi:tetratricopeptide (TPR) repeat protein
MSYSGSIKLFYRICIFATLIILIIPALLAQPAYKYNEEGIKYLNSGQYEEAVGAFEEAYRRAPKNEVIKGNLALAYVNLANEYSKKGDWPKAIIYGERAYELVGGEHKLAQTLSILYTNYATMQMREGLIDEAYDNFKKALEYDENNWVACSNLGRIMYNKGWIKEAVQYWRKAINLNPQLTDIKDRLERIEKEAIAQDKFRKKRFRYFEVRYEGYQNEELARMVLDVLSDAYNELGYEFRYYPHHKIPVIIYTKEQFQGLTGSPDWIGGLFDGIIRVRSSDIKRGENYVRDVLYHEYTHALLYQKTKNNLPIWLNEGLAQYQESNTPFLRPNDLRFLNKRMKEGGLISLSNLDSAFTNRQNQEQLRLAYLEAKLLVKYMKERYYFYRIRHLLDKLSQGKSMDEALKEVLYIDTVKLEKEWLKWLKKNYLKN